MMPLPIPILLYHRIDDSGGSMSTSADVFARHMAWLAERGYRTLRAGELSGILSGTAPGPARPVVVTFDDGYRELDTVVAPILRRHDFSAVAFLITDFVTGPDIAGPDIGPTGSRSAAAAVDGGYLAWPTVRALARDGVFEFHSHTHSHGRWPLEPEQTGAVMDDIAESRALLARELGEPEASFDHLAWPFGRTRPEWETEAIRRGLTTQYVVQRGAVTRPGQLHRLPRLMVDGATPTGLARWMGVLSNRAGARLTNQVFGAVRQHRQSSGYR